MAMLFGAIAYKAVLAERLEKEINSWEVVRQYGNGDRARAASVECPKCGEAYALVEGVDARDETLDEDKEFLAKTLGSAHPVHPARLVIRDPDGIIGKVLDHLLGSTLFVAAFEEQTDRF